MGEIYDSLGETSLKLQHRLEQEESTLEQEQEGRAFVLFYTVQVLLRPKVSQVSPRSVTKVRFSVSCNR